MITNGTAVLGLGAIGPLAAKPVMEGKAVLFKKFAGIDAFDIEIDERDPDKLVEIVAALEPTFGAINLEDIKAPECFEVEAKLRERMHIPVFHDDQHGTAIIVAAAVLQRPATCSASASRRCGSWRAAPAPRRSPASTCWSRSACARRTSLVVDIEGVVYAGRTDADGPVQGALRARRPRSARWPRRSRAPTSSSACRRRAWSSRRWCGPWPSGR